MLVQTDLFQYEQPDEALDHWFMVAIVPAGSMQGSCLRRASVVVVILSWKTGAGGPWG